MERVVTDGYERCLQGSAASNTKPINQTTAGLANCNPNPIPYARKVRILTTGNITLVTTGGDQVTYTGIAAGTIIDWFSTAMILATGLTATYELIY